MSGIQDRLEDTPLSHLFSSGNAYVEPRDKVLKCPVSDREGKRKAETLGSCTRG